MKLQLFVFWNHIEIPNKNTFSYGSKYMERLSGKRSENTDLL